MALIEGVARVSRAAGRIFLSGERRLPACWPRQPAAAPLFKFVEQRKTTVSGKLPETAGWQPALPRNPRRSRW
ncbi:MAG: hypothetical protein DMF27_01510 [Verrucomicrobia bacterium]|nr:MAG: hypothetical protein DMF27_01510 [Verrucomicrobiota bacterium]PYM09848.1 MAG: hypothetical protein DMF15_04140 [Verrucomicrobiota bacterium]